MRNRLFLFCFIILTIGCDENDQSVSPEGTSSIVSDNNGFANDKVTSGETYNDFEENDFIKTSEEATSTFSIDADGGSYSNIRDQINFGQKVQKYSIRTEEIINYFQYD